MRLQGGSRGLVPEPREVTLGLSWSWCCPLPPPWTPGLLVTGQPTRLHCPHPGPVASAAPPVVPFSDGVAQGSLPTPMWAAVPAAWAPDSCMAVGTPTPRPSFPYLMGCQGKGGLWVVALRRPTPARLSNHSGSKCSLSHECSVQSAPQSTDTLHPGVGGRRGPRWAGSGARGNHALHICPGLGAQPPRL